MYFTYVADMALAIVAFSGDFEFSSYLLQPCVKHNMPAAFKYVFV